MMIHWFYVVAATVYGLLIAAGAWSSHRKAQAAPAAAAFGQLVGVGVEALLIYGAVHS